MSSQNQLALVSPQQQQQAIVLATTTRQDARTLRPDDFEIASQPELLEMFIAVACHLNTLQFCHSGRHRFQVCARAMRAPTHWWYRPQVLTTPFIRDSFQSALACIRSTVPDETGRLHMANEDLSLDMWLAALGWTDVAHTHAHAGISTSCPTRSRRAPTRH